MTVSWQKPFRGSRLNHSHPLARNLSLCTILNEGVGDLSTFDHANGLASSIEYGTPTWVAAEKGFCVKPVGTVMNPGRLSWGSANLPSSSPSEISMEIMFRLDSTTGAPVQNMEHAGRRTASGSQWYMYTSWGNESSVNLSFTTSGGTNYQSFSGWGDLPLGEWYHFVWTYDGTRSVTYRNYNEAISVVDPVSNTGALVAANAGFYLGSQYYASDGPVALYRVWHDRILTDADIAWLYHEPYSMFKQPSMTKYFFVPVAGNPWYAYAQQ